MLIFSLGGATYRVSLLMTGVCIFDMNDTDYYTKLIDKIFDRRVVKHLTIQFERKFEKDIYSTAHSVW